MITIRDIFETVNGASFISIDTITDVKLAGGKKNPLQGRVSKKVVGSNVMVFQNKNGSAYESMVNRRLAKEGKSATFEVGPRVWGTRIANTPFVEHNGELYLEVIFLHAGKKELLIDGQPVAKGVTIEGLPAEREESEEGQGGLDNKVVIRTFKAASIKKVTVDHQTYEF